MARNGQQFFDSDTHVGPSMDVLEAYMSWPCTTSSRHTRPRVTACSPSGRPTTPSPPGRCGPSDGPASR